MRLTAWCVFIVINIHFYRTKRLLKEKIFQKKNIENNYEKETYI